MGVAAVAPLPAAWVEYLLQTLTHERDIPPPEDGANHPGQSCDPRMMYKILEIDEDVEESHTAVVLDIVVGDIENMLSIRPPQFVGRTRESSYPDD